MESAQTTIFVEVLYISLEVEQMNQFHCSGLEFHNL